MVLQFFQQFQPTLFVATAGKCLEAVFSIKLGECHDGEFFVQLVDADIAGCRQRFDPLMGVFWQSNCDYALTTP